MDSAITPPCDLPPFDFAAALDGLRREVEAEVERGNGLARQLNQAEGELEQLRRQRAAVLALADEVEQGGIPGLVQAGPYRLASRLREVVGEA